MERDTDWRCTRCRKWHRNTAALCRHCGRPNVDNVTRRRIRCAAEWQYVANTERKYGLLPDRSTDDDSTPRDEPS